MIDPKSILHELNKNLNILQEREAKYGGNTPIELLNQISDYKQAIKLTQQLIAGEITEGEWQASKEQSLAFNRGEVVKIEAGIYIAGNINLIVQGDYVTKLIVKEEVSIFKGLLNRFILAQNLIFGIVGSFLRGDPFPYAKSFEMVALCISASNKEAEDWFKEWFSELNTLINNPKTGSDFNKIASELWLVTQLIEISYAKNKSSTEHLATLIADFQRIRSKAIESLSNYSQELARAHSNLIHLQSVLYNSSPPIQEHLKIVENWIGLLTSNYINTLKNFTPTNLVEEIDNYITRNPDGVSPSILGMFSNVKTLLIWTIKYNESNFESKIGKVLSSFSDLIPPTSVPDGFSLSKDKASKPSINQLAFVLQHAREQSQILASNREEIKGLRQGLSKLTEDNSRLEVRLSVSNEQINQKEKALQEKFSAIKQLKLEHSNLESQQLQIERKLAGITHDIRELKTFLDETQNKTSSLETMNRTLEMVNLLWNKSEAKNQQVVGTSSCLAASPSVEEEKGVLPPQFWLSLSRSNFCLKGMPKSPFWPGFGHPGRANLDPLSLPKRTKNDLNENLIMDPQVRQQTLEFLNMIQLKRSGESLKIPKHIKGRTIGHY